jgi:hypothetical protein
MVINPLNLFPTVKHQLSAVRGERWLLPFYHQMNQSQVEVEVIRKKFAMRTKKVRALV